MKTQSLDRPLALIGNGSLYPYVSGVAVTNFWSKINNLKSFVFLK
jgi:hypothetical protein